MSPEGKAKLALLRATDAQAMAMANSFVLRALLDGTVGYTRLTYLSSGKNRMID